MFGFMFKLVRCGENTYYLDSFTKTGVYDLKNGEVILVDSCDHRKSVADLDFHLENHGWRVAAIINTHAHIDHITGNRFFSKKYGCEVFSGEPERHLVELCNLEGEIYYNGLPLNRKRSYFFQPVGTKARPLCELSLPKGFELLSLPGHSFGMTGVKTPDNVFFLGDAVLSRETFENYKLPFFFEINKSIETQKKIAALEGSFFVPSHAEATESIASLALYNAECLQKLKDYFLSISGEKTLEEIFSLCAEQLELRLNTEQYGKLLTTVKSFLQSLIDDKKLTAVIGERHLPVYKTL